jgi:hypothetical protein
MRMLFFSMACMLLSTMMQAQISDEEAKQAYQDAEEQYEAANYYKCYQMCNDLIVKMGKPNPRILYLDLKAIYNNLESKNDKSEYSLKKNFRNYERFSGYCDDFFAAVDKSTYPADKYAEIVEIQKYLKEGVKQYAYEKDRKPEDAIAFLNQCAQKFAHKNHNTRYINYHTGDCHFSFSLDSAYLIINVLANLTGDAPRYHWVARERIRIDLSKVWIETGAFQYYIIYKDFLYNEFGYMTSILEKYGSALTDKEAPIIVSTKTYADNKAKYDNINWYWNWNYDRKMEFPQEKFESEINRLGYRKIGSGFYIYNLFETGSEEFRDGNYRKRIKDAFEFLIEYFGGGTPVDTPQEIKSKF